MNPFVKGMNKNPFGSLKKVVLEAAAAAAATAAAATASVGATAVTGNTQDSIHLPSLDAHPDQGLRKMPQKVNTKQPDAAPLPSGSNALGDDFDEHGLAGFFIRVTLLSGSSLLGKNDNGTSDPIVQLDYDGRVVFSTVCKSTNNPTWNECFTFNVSTKNPKLTLTVWNHTKFITGPDTVGSFLGTACLEDASSSVGIVQNVMLLKKSSQNLMGGCICIKIDDPALKSSESHSKRRAAQKRTVQVAPTWIQIDPPQDESWLELFYDILVTSKQKGWYISPTITFKFHKAKSYYYNDSEGCVLKTDISKKKAQNSMDLFSIFCAKSDTKYSNIAAIYVYNESINGSVKPCIAYLTQDETREFLSDLSGRDHNGVLVAFEDPPIVSAKNTVIRAMWTPHMLHHECRQNVHRIDAHQERVLPEDRACTFDGRQHQSNRMAASKSITNCIERKVEAFADFFRQYMTDRNHLDAMVLYFKVGQPGRQQCKFLWCTSAKFTKSAVHAKAVTAIEDIRVLNPLDFANSRSSTTFQSYRPSTCEQIHHRGTGALQIEKLDEKPPSKQTASIDKPSESESGSVEIFNPDEDDDIEIVSMEDLLRERQAALLSALNAKDVEPPKVETLMPLWEGIPQMKEIFESIFEMEMNDPYAPRRAKKVISVQSWLKYCAEKQVSTKLHCAKSQLKHAFVIQKKDPKMPGSPKAHGLDLNFLEFCKLCIYVTKNFRLVVESKCKEKIDWSFVHTNADPKRCNSDTVTAVNALLNDVLSLHGSTASLNSSAPIDAKLTKRLQERKSKMDVCPLCKSSLRCSGFGNPWAQTFDTPATEVFIFFAMYGFEHGYTMLARKKDTYMSKEGSAKRLRMLIDLVSQSSPLKFGKALNPLILEDQHALKLTYIAFANFVSELFKSAGSLLPISPESLINSSKDSELLTQNIPVCESCSLALTSCKFEILKVSMATPSSVATVPHPSLIFGAHSRRVPSAMKPQPKKKLVSPMPAILPALMQVSTPTSAFRTSWVVPNRDSRDCGTSPMHSSHGLGAGNAEEDDGV